MQFGIQLMIEKYNVLLENSTWDLVPSPSSINLLAASGYTRSNKKRMVLFSVSKLGE